MAIPAPFRLSYLMRWLAGKVSDEFSAFVCLEVAWYTKHFALTTHNFIPIKYRLGAKTALTTYENDHNPSGITNDSNQ